MYCPLTTLVTSTDAKESNFEILHQQLKHKSFSLPTLASNDYITLTFSSRKFSYSSEHVVFYATLNSHKAIVVKFRIRDNSVYHMDLPHAAAMKKRYDFLSNFIEEAGLSGCIRVNNLAFLVFNGNLLWCEQLIGSFGKFIVPYIQDDYMRLLSCVSYRLRVLQKRMFVKFGFTVVDLQGGDRKSVV